VKTTLLQEWEVTVVSSRLLLESSTERARSVVTDLAVQADNSSAGTLETLVVPTSLVSILSQFSAPISLDFQKLRELCEELGIDLSRSAREVLTELKNRGLFSDEALATLFLALEEHGLFLDESAATLFLAASELNLFAEISGAAIVAFCTGESISIDMFAREIARYVETHSAEVDGALRSMNLRADTVQFVRSMGEVGGAVVSMVAGTETEATLLTLEVQQEPYEARATVEKSVRQAAAVPLGRLDYEIRVTVGPAQPSALLVVDVLQADLQLLPDEIDSTAPQPQGFRDESGRTYVAWYLDDFIEETQGPWSVTLQLPVRVRTPPLLPRTDLED